MVPEKAPGTFCCYKKVLSMKSETSISSEKKQQNYVQWYLSFEKRTFRLKNVPFIIQKHNFYFCFKKVSLSLVRRLVLFKRYLSELFQKGTSSFLKRYLFKKGTFLKFFHSWKSQFWHKKRYLFGLKKVPVCIKKVSQKIPFWIKKRTFQGTFFFQKGTFLETFFHSKRYLF